MIMDKILEVKNLKISFRTSGGTLKAVRNISFDLERGKTFAIVGESGSGKSVTSKAILGILAGNSIIEGGEILYDGKDLLKISEDEMYKIRGDKISMIFQDPLSSLNPIVKIGKQITEAMLLKNRANRREAKSEFNKLLSLLKENMINAAGTASKQKIEEMIKTFNKFCIEATKLENSYNTSESAAGEIVSDIEDFLFMTSKKQKVDVKTTLKDIAKRMQRIKDPFLTVNHSYEITSLSSELSNAASEYKAPKAKDGETVETVLPENIEKILENIKSLMRDMTESPRPDFFRIGYYKLQNPNEDPSKVPVEELNDKALDFLNKNFMDEFLAIEEKGVRYSYETALEKKKALIPKLEEARRFYLGDFEKAQALSKCKTLSAEVESSIDRLEIVKDSAAYTFRSSLTNAIEQYFYYKKYNVKEEKRFDKQSKKRDAMIARGKKVDWKVVPKNVHDIDELKGNITAVIDRLLERYNSYIAASENIDFRARGIEIIDFLKDKASQVVYRVTKSMAKEMAIKLMDEVGIHDPRTRYYQYPFEFSGGMRQRIVIAIALAANPDILICDEPTTALDVTIQAQILELINRLKKERNLSVIFITHDLGVVANMADTIAVMYAGKIVERGTADEIFYDPRHPYTWALLSSMPDLDTSEKLDAIPGTPPNMIYPPVGDAFADRNKYAMKIDFEMEPPMFDITPTHQAATWLLHPDAPKVEVPKIITDRIARMKKKQTGGEQHGE